MLSAITGAAYSTSVTAAMCGVTRPVIVELQITPRDGTVRLRGTFDVKQSAFKIRAPSAGLGTVNVADRVTFDADITARRAR